MSDVVSLETSPLPVREKSEKELRSEIEHVPSVPMKWGRVDVHQPGLCWRCGRRGHVRQDCKGTPLRFCSGCGRMNVRSFDCCRRVPGVGSNKAGMSDKLPPSSQPSGRGISNDAAVQPSGGRTYKDAAVQVGPPSRLRRSASAQAGEPAKLRRTAQVQVDPSTSPSVRGRPSLVYTRR